MLDITEDKVQLSPRPVCILKAAAGCLCLDGSLKWRGTHAFLCERVRPFQGCDNSESTRLDLALHENGPSQTLYCDMELLLEQVLLEINPETNMLQLSSG